VRWFVTGARGQLGAALVQVLAGRGEAVDAHDSTLDVADSDAVAETLLRSPGGPPEILVNAAAFTHVDRCEREPEAAERVNAGAPSGLARLCRGPGVRLVHVSTDYVFDGESKVAYDEDAAPAPQSVYGRTKLAGEQAVLEADPGFLVIRTSWVFGRGRNFVANVLAQAAKRGQAGEPLSVVDDQTGRPTYATDLAQGIVRLVEGGRCGLYHLAGGGTATWWELARTALDHAGWSELPIERIRTADLDLPAPRPRNSVLDCGKAEAAGVRLRDWREALAAYLDSPDAPSAAV
jgi:dTDP-4-dehydrorhamnose reductase